MHHINMHSTFRLDMAILLNNLHLIRILFNFINSIIHCYLFKIILMYLIEISCFNFSCFIRLCYFTFNLQFDYFMFNLQFDYSMFNLQFDYFVFNLQFDYFIKNFMLYLLLGFNYFIMYLMMNFDWSKQNLKRLQYFMFSFVNYSNFNLTLISQMLLINFKFQIMNRFATI